MTEKDKKIWLNRLWAGMYELEKLKERRLTVYERATKTTIGMVAVRGNGSTKERVFTDVAIATEEIETLCGELRAAKTEILQAIMALEDCLLRCVLIHRYVNLRTFQEIASALELSERHILRLHGEALKQLEITKDERMQNIWTLQ